MNIEQAVEESWGKSVAFYAINNCLRRMPKQNKNQAISAEERDRRISGFYISNNMYAKSPGNPAIQWSLDKM